MMYTFSYSLAVEFFDAYKNQGKACQEKIYFISKQRITVNIYINDGGNK